MFLVSKSLEEGICRSLAECHGGLDMYGLLWLLAPSIGNIKWLDKNSFHYLQTVPYDLASKDLRINTFSITLPLQYSAPLVCFMQKLMSTVDRL